MRKKPDAAARASVYADLCKEKQELLEKYKALSITQEIIAERMAKITFRIHKVSEMQKEIKDLVTGK